MDSEGLEIVYSDFLKRRGGCILFIFKKFTLKQFSVKVSWLANSTVWLRSMQGHFFSVILENICLNFRSFISSLYCKLYKAKVRRAVFSVPEPITWNSISDAEQKSGSRNRL